MEPRETAVAEDKAMYTKRTRAEQWHAMATALVANAAKEGFEVTVESVSLKPYAMRNKKSVVTITEKR